VRNRSLHRQQRDDFKQMVLQHIANRTHAIVKSAAPGYSERFGHCDLHALHVIAIPDRLKEGIGKTKIEQILHRLLAQKMVDAEHGGFGKR